MLRVEVGGFLCWLMLSHFLWKYLNTAIMSTNFLHQSAFGEKYCHQCMRIRERFLLYLRWSELKQRLKHIADLMSEGSDKSQFSICVKIPAETEFLFSEQFNSNKTFLAPFYISLQLTDTQRRDQMPEHRPSNLKYFHFWKKNPDPLMTWIICQVGCLM